MTAAIDITVYPKSAAHRDPFWLRSKAMAFLADCDDSADVSLAEFREWAEVPESIVDNATVLREVMAAREALPTTCPGCNGTRYRDDDTKCDRRLCCDGTLDYPRVTP